MYPMILTLLLSISKAHQQRQAHQKMLGTWLVLKAVHFQGEQLLLGNGPVSNIPSVISILSETVRLISTYWGTCNEFKIGSLH